MVVLNPLLDLEAGGPRLKAIVAGVRRADAVVFYSRGARDDAIGLGIDPDRAVFLPLGVAARVTRPDPPGTFLLATGKDRRDWETLAEAAHGLDSEVLVAGPAPSQVPAPLRVVRPGSREAYLDLVARAAAVVIPLVDGHRQAGQLALLDAFSLGRGVVASRGRGTEDYVTAERGVLVDPGDPDALRVAMQQVLDPIVSTELGAGAFRAIQGELSILNFVEGVAAQVDRSIVRRRRDGPR
jgi:glycosyltransferase involved in cell wall biosynthesis